MAYLDHAERAAPRQTTLKDVVQINTGEAAIGKLRASVNQVYDRWLKPSEN